MQRVIASQELKSTCKQRQSLAILVLMLYTIAMLKRGNGKTYRLYKKNEKSFLKAPCEALDIKQRIGQNSQLHSFTASQLHSFTASQLHSFTASQLRLSHAQINLQSNTKKIYSHKKPQGTQSVELRSTSQRNNRHVLGIGTRQSKRREE